MDDKYIVINGNSAIISFKFAVFSSNQTHNNARLINSRQVCIFITCRRREKAYCTCTYKFFRIHNFSNLYILRLSCHDFLRQPR